MWDLLKVKAKEVDARNINELIKVNNTMARKVTVDELLDKDL